MPSVHAACCACSRPLLMWWTAPAPGIDVPKGACASHSRPCDIALIDADAEAHAASLFHVGIALRHNPLDHHRALDRVHDASELSEDAIAGGVDNPTAVLRDHREYDGLMLLETAN